MRLYLRECSWKSTLVWVYDTQLQQFYYGFYAAKIGSLQRKIHMHFKGLQQYNTTIVNSTDSMNHLIVQVFI